MADDPKQEAGGKPPRSPLMLIVAVCAAVMAGAAGSMYVMMKKMVAPPAAGAGAPGAPGAPAAAAGPPPDEPPPAEEEGEGAGQSVVTMAPFVVNLEDDNGEAHFLKMTLAVELKDPKWSKYFEHQTPKVRNAVVLLLSNLRTSQTQGAQNKRKLVEELRTAVVEAMGKNAIKEIYLTEFVIQ